MNVFAVSFFRHDASGYESERAGVARGKFFDNFIDTLLRAQRVAFPGWYLWVYHDDRVPDLPSFGRLIAGHEIGALKLISMGKAETLCGAMLWRLLPVYDPLVSHIVCRDVDSLPMHRDYKMVSEFVGSGADAHAILDSESHSGPFMGGMTAFRAQAVKDVLPVAALAETRLDRYNQHGSDQMFLNTRLWPHLKSRTLIHQRRQDVSYPDAMETRKVLPQETPLDKVVRHIGAGYDVAKADQVLREHYGT